MIKFEKILLCIVIFFFLLVGIFTYVSAKREAEFYTRITGVKVTWSDAFFLDLDPSKHVIQVEGEKK